MPSCLNCGSTLTGRFCAACGQRDLPPRPTLRELAGDALAELLGWDGKLAATLKLLVTAPGELAAAFLDGRRARYISPLRLYLTCSLVFFLVDAGAPTPPAASFEAGVSIGAAAETVSPGDAAFAKAMSTGLASLTPAERALVDGELAKQPAWMRPAMRKLAEDASGVQRQIDEWLPRAFFVLIPGLALTLAIFFRRRHFPEHLYVALHVQTAGFAAMTLATLVQYVSFAPTAIITATVIAVVAAAAYAIAALRRVYGGSWAATTARALGVALLYALLYSSVTTVILLWATRR